MRKSVSKKLTGAILWTLCFQALPGVAGAMPTYQLDDSTVTVDRYEEPKAEPVDIPAEPEAPDEIAGGNTARTADYGTLGKRDVMTTPFNMTTFTEKMIQDRQAASVNDVIANDASTTDQTLSGASQAWNIRGFKSTQQDVSFNGLYGVAPRFYSGVEGLDRVEVLPLVWNTFSRTPVFPSSVRWLRSRSWPNCRPFPKERVRLFWFSPALARLGTKLMLPPTEPLGAMP